RRAVGIPSEGMIMLSKQSIWTAPFWKATAERAIATAAQAVLAFVAVDSVAVNALTLDWPAIGGIALGGALLSVLKSLGANLATGTGPSLSNSEKIADADDLD